MTKNHETNITQKILLTLVDLVKAPIEVFLETPYKGFSMTDKKQIYPRINNLEKGGYIRKNKNIMYLTNKGKQKAYFIKWKLRKINIKNWDGKWRVLSFDIPEKQKRLRDNLRRKLFNLNLVRLHDSVWITPLPIENEINQLLQILEIKYFVRYMLVEKINYDKDLKKKFFI